MTEPTSHTPEESEESGVRPSGRCDARCPWCGREAPVIPVHGHGQCGACGTNREPCCQPD